MSLGARLLALAQAVGNDFKALFNDKVDKVSGKVLSSNDYTTEDKEQLAALVLAVEEAQAQIITMQTQIDELSP